MSVALLVVFPIGILQAAAAFPHPLLVLAGVGVGICSSVIPYICDQLAMARLPRATFALMLTLLPASATLIGAIVLCQIPSSRDLLGIALVMAGVALHRQPQAQ
jgi:inner membrane transporter RhtA